MKGSPFARPASRTHTYPCPWRIVYTSFANLIKGTESHSNE